jgi:electron transport complex protein RnfD
MVAYAVMIVSYPRLMSGWPVSANLLGSDLAAQLSVIFHGTPLTDAMTMATPLDLLRTGLHMPDSKATVGTLLAGSPSMGILAGRGWEWIALAYLAGGAWMIQQRIITWHVPLTFLGALAAIAGLGWVLHPEGYASPLFHLVAGGTMLGAFFILTDPVSGSTTPKGRLIFAAGAALLVWLIRNFGGYPDGVAFAVLIMNLCVPLIDAYTQPPVFGHKGGGARSSATERQP